MMEDKKSFNNTLNHQMDKESIIKIQNGIRVVEKLKIKKKEQEVLLFKKIERVNKKDSYSFYNVTPYSSSLDMKIFSTIGKRTLKKIILKGISKPLRRSASFYIDYILEYSQVYSIDPIWVTSIIWTESHFKRYAKSHVNAIGLMQIMPKTGEYLLKLLMVKRSKKAIRNILINPKNNIELGIFYLKKLLNRFKSHSYATIAYNMGPTFVSKRIRNKGQLGVTNDYLNKINKRYYLLLKTLKRSVDFRKISYKIK